MNPNKIFWDSLASRSDFCLSLILSSSINSRILYLGLQKSSTSDIDLYYYPELSWYSIYSSILLWLELLSVIRYLGYENGYLGGSSITRVTYLELIFELW